MIVDSLVDHCRLRLGVEIEARFEDGKLYIQTTDPASWYLARQAAREQFGFRQESIVWEKL